MEPSSDSARLAALAGEALDCVAAAGLTAEVAASIEQGLSLRLRLGQTDKVEFRHGQAFGVTVHDREGRTGRASTNDLSSAAIRQAVASACAIARYTQPDDCAGLASPDQICRDLPDLGLYHPWSGDVARAQTVALDGEAGAMSIAGVERCESFSVSSHCVLRLQANSHGLLAVIPSSRHALGCSVIAREGSSMHRDHWGLSQRRFEALPSPFDVGLEAATRVLARRGARKIATGRFPVIFRADVAGGLFSSLLGALSGGALYRKSSYLEQSLGMRILPRGVNVFEDPRLHEGYGSSPIDSDGLATRQQHFIHDGVVERYLLGTYSARKLGLASTANAGGARNVRVTGLQVAMGDLIKGVFRGLLVTELMGQGINLVTGDYSRGAAGFWIENGEIVHAVHEVTIASNLRDMFQQIEAIGDDIDRRGDLHCGSVLISEMVVAGQ